MATSSGDRSKDKAQAKRATTEAKKSASASAAAGKRAVAKSAAAQKSQVQTVAETAVDFPVGVVLSVSDRVGELVRGRVVHREENLPRLDGVGDEGPGRDPAAL